jgi:2-polyprenyl-3-methyl-5-hydroxy-6-metoxy-1,4-benzoquinol methylase
VTGSILFLAAVFSVVGAVVFQRLGLVSPDLGPLPFVGAVVCVKLGLFAFWPEIARKGRQASMTLHDWRADLDRGIFAKAPTTPRSMVPVLLKKPKSLSLWDQNDPRLDLSLFANNVPSFVLNHEQRFLDWNPAFDLVFGAERAVRRGAHVAGWFDLLDNYRRVSKRAEKLYGEGILPLADRDRVVYLSPEFGRLVFTKIMTPVIDRATGRVIGWNVVLNLNSATRRHEFFERLHARLTLESRRLRHAASFNGIFDAYRPLTALVRAHVDKAADARRVLEIGAGTGLLTSALATTSRRVTAVDHNVHLLRQLRDRVALAAHRVRIVKQSPEHLHGLPPERFDAATLLLTLHKLEDPAACLRQVFAALKPGAPVGVSVLTCGPQVDGFFNAVRTDLERQDRFELLKHQFTHVLEHERELAAVLPYRALTRLDVRALLLEAGFNLESEADDLLDGHAVLVTARKPL